MYKTNVIRKSLILLFGLVCFYKLTAQEKHVIFIQNENKQPFYVQLNGQTYSSTASGFLILSQLMVGKYYLIAGFPKDIYPEQKFVVDIEKYDKEFSLKKLTDKEFALVDMIDNVTLKPENSTNVVINSETENKKAVAVDDTAATTTPLAKKDTLLAQAAADIPAGNNLITPPAANSTTMAIVVPPKTSNPNFIILKTFERISSTGIDLIYVDKTNIKADTIAIYIPSAEAKGSKPLTKVAEPVKPSPVKVTIANDVAVAAKPEATNEDFLKTRLDMAAAATEEDMLKAAKLSFKNKMYTTEQIKNLGVLFLNEKGRLRFFEIAKPSISDINHFAMLQNQFTQPDLIDKFNSLNKKD